MNKTNEYLSGEKLYGDDYSFDEIKKWYEEEKEGYADLGSKEFDKYRYYYHELNKDQGYKYLPKSKSAVFSNVLGFGSAYGSEFEPIIERISNLYILEPSDSLVAKKIGNVVPVYKKPEISGKIDFPDDFFDLITCFGTLHHIPNVTFVLEELYRILKPGGFLLIREPVISMGDWTKARKELTKNERGIPVKIFKSTINRLGFKIKAENYNSFLITVLQKIIGGFFKKPLYAYKIFIVPDRVLSNLLKWNIKYHAVNVFRKIAPKNVFFVLSKKGK